MTLLQGEAFRVATHIPWDDDQGPKWSKRWDTEDQAVADLMRRARKHTGDQFRLRERNEDFGVRRTIKALDDAVHMRIGAKFDVGDMLIVKSEADLTRWVIRKVHVEPLLMDTDGNPGIDLNHTLIFSANKAAHPGAESWGILNKRYISGTTIWSQHSPWNEDACTSNAEDFHADTIAAMRAIADDCIAHGSVAKALLAGYEWLDDGRGWRYVGSFIDHYDHAHIEAYPTRSRLC